MQVKTQIASHTLQDVRPGDRFIYRGDEYTALQQCPLLPENSAFGSQFWCYSNGSIMSWYRTVEPVDITNREPETVELRTLSPGEAFAGFGYVGIVMSHKPTNCTNIVAFRDGDKPSISFDWSGIKVRRVTPILLEVK